MRQEERFRWLDAFLAMLAEPFDAPGSASLDALSQHFKTAGRVLFLAEEMAVLYPGERPFVPVFLAVADVPDLETDPRMAWVVADEDKGPDLLIEMLHHGDPVEALAPNVARFAALGVREYVVVDRRNGSVQGYRLPDTAVHCYEPIVPQRGRIHSQVLGLELAIEHGSLVFFQGTERRYHAAEVLARLDHRRQNLDAAVTTDEARAAHQARTEQAVDALRMAILTTLEVRGMALTDALQGRVLTCDDVISLTRWLEHVRRLDETAPLVPLEAIFT